MSTLRELSLREEILYDKLKADLAVKKAELNSAKAKIRDYWAHKNAVTSDECTLFGVLKIQVEAAIQALEFMIQEIENPTKQA